MCNIHSYRNYLLDYLEGFDHDDDGDKDSTANGNSKEAQFLMLSQGRFVGSKRKAAIKACVLELLPSILAAGNEATNTQKQDEEPSSQLYGRCHGQIVTSRAHSFHRQLLHLI